MERAINSTTPLLILRAGKLTCALQLSEVVEVMRCLPVTAVSNLPPFVMGVSIIRGDKVPIVDLAAALGSDDGSARRTRLVTVRAGSRSVALAVGSVIGVRELDRTVLAAIPPLLSSAHPEALSAIAVLDRELLLVLDGSRIVPANFLAQMANDEERRANN